MPPSEAQTFIVGKLEELDEEELPVLSPGLGRWADRGAGAVESLSLPKRLLVSMMVFFLRHLTHQTWASKGIQRYKGTETHSIKFWFEMISLNHPEPF